MAEGSACIQPEDGEVQGDQGVGGEGVVSAEDFTSCTLVRWPKWPK